MNSSPFNDPSFRGDNLSAKRTDPIDPGWAAWLRSIYEPKKSDHQMGDLIPGEPDKVERDSLD